MNSQDQKTILLVEDERITAQLEKRQLEQYGYRVHHVATGEDAVKAMQDCALQVDLILMDIDLGPGIDGTQAATQILDITEVPIVFLSSHTEREVVEKTEKIAGYGYVVKNTGIVVLVTSIKIAFQQKRAEAALKASEARLQAIMDNSPSLISEIDLDGRYKLVNPALAATLDLRPTQVTGKSFEELLPPAIARLFRQRTEQVQASGRAIHVEDSINTVSGTQHYLTTLFPLPNEKGDLNSIGAIAQDITERKQAEEYLQQLEWMLSEKSSNTSDYIPQYDDLTALNTHGIILSTLGKKQLLEISGDYLDLLRSSSAIYEKNGDYALGIFSSGWCRMMDTQSRKLCKTDDNQQALSCGQWLCHESCWKTSKTAMESGQPVDRACSGGIRMYAVPVRVNGEVIGAINFGYGDPPEDDSTLQKIASLYNIPVEKLRKKQQEHQTRPQFVIDYAKKRIQYSAELIAKLIEHKQAEVEIQKQLSEKETLLREVHHRIKNNIMNIEACLLLQEDSLDNQEAKIALQDAISRVQSMRILYDKLLIASDLSQISIKTYIEELVDSINSFSGKEFISMEKHISDFTINPRTAITVGIIINELLTNVYKYAFEKRATGAVAVSISNIKNAVTITIQDNGIGLNEATIKEKSSGLGLTLVKMLVQQLNGTHTTENANGTKHIIIFEKPARH